MLIQCTYNIYCTPIKIGHVLNKQGTEDEHIFSWYEYSVSIGLKIRYVL